MARQQDTSRLERIPPGRRVRAGRAAASSPGHAPRRPTGPCGRAASAASHSSTAVVDAQLGAHRPGPLQRSSGGAGSPAASQTRPPRPAGLSIRRRPSRTGGGGSPAVGRQLRAASRLRSRRRSAPVAASGIDHDAVGMDGEGQIDGGGESPSGGGMISGQPRDLAQQQCAARPGPRRRRCRRTWPTTGRPGGGLRRACPGLWPAGDVAEDDRLGEAVTQPLGHARRVPRRRPLGRRRAGPSSRERCHLAHVHALLVQLVVVPMDGAAVPVRRGRGLRVVAPC